MSLLFPTVVLLNSKETQAELGWTSYPPNGVSVLACISWFHIMFVLHVTPHLRGSTSQLMFVCFFIALYGELFSLQKTDFEGQDKQGKKIEGLEKNGKIRVYLFHSSLSLTEIVGYINQLQTIVYLY